MSTPLSLLSRPTRTRPAVAALAIGAALGFGALLPAAPAFAQFAGASAGQIPASFADVVDRVKGSVVSIYVVGGGESKLKTAQAAPHQKMPEFKGIPGFPDELNEYLKKKLPKEFGGDNDNEGGGLTMAQGSGFVISDDGYVVTNNHVIENASKIELAFDTGNAEHEHRLEAELVGTDPRTDIALLKIKSPIGKLPFVKLTDKPPRVGDWVLAVGNPFGFGGTVTAGIVSALARDVGSGPYDYMQIDAAVNRGNSGGPTFNLNGDVIGVNTAIYSPSGGNVGIAFDVPAKTVLDVVDQLKTKGSVSRGWLGVKIQNVDDDTAASLGLSDAHGALVNEVTSGGPAAGAGIQNGDAILTVDGQRVADSRDLARKIAALSPSAPAEIGILRGGKQQTVSVKLGDFKNAMGTSSEPTKPDVPKAHASTDLGALGLKLANGKGAHDGVQIVDVDDSSDAALKGLRPGDTIVEVSGQPVTSVDDVSKALAEANKLGRRALLLRVKSGDQARFVAIQIKKG